MRIKLNYYGNGPAWYMRDYLHGRTCEVIAARPFSYFVLHPITKKPGYWINKRHCVELTYDKIPSWDEFLANNDYGYSRDFRETSNALKGVKLRIHSIGD